MNLNEIRQRVRTILGDRNDNMYIFSDSVLDGHIQHAVEIFSRYLPLEESAEVQTTLGSWEVQLPPKLSFSRIKAFEYPLGVFPPHHCSFTLWAGVITLFTNECPDGSPAKVHYVKNHTVDEESSTISPAYKNLLATGSAALATYEEAFKATNRVNSGGKEVSQRYLDWAREKINAYCQVLERLARTNNIYVNRLFRF